MKTISPEVAKQLKEAGFPQEGEFWYASELKTSDGETFFYTPIEFPLIMPYIVDYDYRKDYAAPTADEIIDQLPKELIGDEGMRFDLNIYTVGKNYFIAYWWDEDSRRSSGMKIATFDSPILAAAAAEMWLYLKKSELI